MWIAERQSNSTLGLSVAYPNFTDWRAQQTVFDRFGCYMPDNFVLTGRGDPVQVRGARMSADVFQVLQIQPALGRVFNENEDKPGATPVVLLSYSFWQGRFGGDPAMLGQTITLDEQTCTVVGVMPAAFVFPIDVNLWIPLGPLTGDSNWLNRGNHPNLSGLARLKPGVTLEQARAHLDAIALRLEQQYPDTNKARRVKVEPLLHTIVGDIGRNLWMLFGAVGVLLLIACANVANLLLARALSRQREFAVRAALGASRWQIVRQLLTESVLLSALGCAAGLLLAQGALPVIATLAKSSVPRVGGISLDSPVLLFSVGTAVFTGVLFGLVPAWQPRRLNLQNSLKGVALGMIGRPGRLRGGLVVGQIALTLLLLVGAGLLLRSFFHLLEVNPGFVSERVLSFRVDLPRRKYPSEERGLSFYRELMDGLRALPGVEAASIASRIPLDGRDNGTYFLVEGQLEPPADSEKPYMEFQVIAPDYFRVMGIPLLRGRDFTDADSRSFHAGADSQQATALNAIIVDEDFAKRYWPNGDAVGERVRLPRGGKGKDQVLTVVGVVGRVKLLHLSEHEGNFRAYLPFLQSPRRGMTVVVKTPLEVEALVSSARQQVQAIDPEQPIHEVRTLAELCANSSASTRLYLILLAAFAAVAVALASIGLYGVLAYIVTKGQREIGVRMALGAQRHNVLALVVGQGMKLALLGACLGLFGAFALVRVLTNLLFEVKPLDPITFTLVPVLLLAVAAIASWVPARRAAKIDPMVALRYE